MAEKKDIPQEFWDDLFVSVATTTDGVKQFCISHGYTYPLIWKRLLDDENLMKKYLVSRGHQIEMLVEQMCQLEQECMDKINKQPHDSRKVNAIVQFYKIKTDNIKWIASRLLARYSDKIDQNIKTTGDMKVEFLFPPKPERGSDGVQGIREGKEGEKGEGPVFG